MELQKHEKEDFVQEILKWTAMNDYNPLTDEEVISIAGQVFLELDKEEMNEAAQER